MSRTVRQTGLIAGAKLELVVASKSPSVVSIALQLSASDANDIPGGRLTAKFPSNTTLWIILRSFESDGQRNLNFTGRGVAQTDAGVSGAGRIYYEAPVLNIMGRELSSFADFQKTLAQLGINSGSSLIRLTFRKTDTPLEEAMSEIVNHFQSAEATESTISRENVTTAPNTKSEDNIQDIPVSDAVGNESNSEIYPSATAISVDTPASDTAADSISTSEAPLQEQVPKEEIIVGPNRRLVSVFSAPASDTPKAALLPHNEADYEPTIAHAKLHQSFLQSRTQNTRLPSDAEATAIAAEKAAKQSSIKEVSVKVRFPDQSSVVSTFDNTDSGAAFYDFVKGVIVAENEPFALVWMGPKGPLTVPDDADTKLIKDLKFGGRMLVNFHWQDGVSREVRSSTMLKAEFADKAKELQVQQVIAIDSLENDGDQSTNAPKDEDKEKRVEQGGKPKGVPKWLKLPGKK